MHLLHSHGELFQNAPQTSFAVMMGSVLMLAGHVMGHMTVMTEVMSQLSAVRSCH